MRVTDGNCPLRLRCANSIPARVISALLKDLNPSMAAQRRLVARYRSRGRPRTDMYVSSTRQEEFTGLAYPAQRLWKLDRFASYHSQRRIHAGLGGASDSAEC